MGKQHTLNMFASSQFLTLQADPSSTRVWWDHHVEVATSHDPQHGTSHDDSSEYHQWQDLQLLAHQTQRVL